MAEQPVLELLSKLSAGKLRGMQHDIDVKVADLQTQREWIDRALKAKNGAHVVISGGGGQIHVGGRKGTTALIRDVLSQRPGYVWKPAEVIEQLRARGSESSGAAIRVALRRMAEPPNNILERGPNGTGWRLASSNGSLGESFSEAPISGSEQYERQTSRIGNSDLGASTPGTTVPELM